MNRAARRPQAADWEGLDLYGPLGFVYFMTNGPETKIGFSRSTPHRKKALERDHGPLEVLGFFRGNQSEEINVHAKFQHLRLHGEWFKSSPEIVEFVADLEFVKGSLASRHLTILAILAGAHQDIIARRHRRRATQ